MTRTQWSWLMISPVIIGLLVFTIGPMLVSLGLSFTDYDVVNPPHVVGAANYRYLLFADPSFWISVRVTAIYAAVSVPLGLFVALVVAMLLNMEVPFRGAFRTLYYLPTLLPATVSGVLWAWIFHPTDGALNHLLLAAGIHGPAWTSSPSWALPALIIISVWSYGGAMVVFLAGLQGTSKTLMEAAQLDGAGPWRRFRVVTWPALTPTLFFNLTMSLIGAMKAFDQAFAFGQSGPGVGGPARATLFYVLNLYTKAFEHFHMGLASAMAWLLFAVIGALTALNFWLSKRWVYDEGA
jgi:multiple sugar transport system permease protein